MSTNTEAPQKPFSFFRGNYFIIVLSWILIDLSFELPGTYYALYVLHLGGTETIIGMIGFASFIAMASVQFPGGYLADKFGRKWLISSLTFAVAFCYILYAVAPSWHFIMVGAIILGLVSMYDPAINAIVADSLPPGKRGMGFGIVMLIVSASTTPGPYIAGILYNRFGLEYGMRIAYGIVVALWIGAAILRLRLTETIANTRIPSLNELIHSYPTSVKESVGVWKKVPASLFYLLMAFIIFNLGWAAAQPYLVIYATKVLGIAEATWPLILTALFLTTIAFALPVGKIVDIFNRKTPLLLSFVAAIIAVWLFIYGDLVRLFVSLVVFGIAMVLARSAYSALEADLTPKEQRGKISGFRNVLTYIALGSGNFIGGAMYEYFSPQTPFFFALILFVPAFLLTLALVQEPEQREE